MRKILLALMFLALVAPSRGYTDENYVSIELFGQWDENISRSFGTEVLLIPIEGCLYDNKVLAFYIACDISNLTILISKNGIPVLQRTLNAINGQTETFAFQGYEFGKYKVVLTTPHGSYVYGFFELT